MLRGRIGASAAGAVLAAVLALAGCAPHAQKLMIRPSATVGATGHATPSGHASAAPATAGDAPSEVGVAGAFRVGRRQLTFTEPAHAGPSGQSLGPRTLVVPVWYPAAARAAGSPPAAGPFPLLLFAPGFQQCAAPYGDLLASWAAAGYVVAAVNFPHSDCVAGAAATETDLINQPGDMSYVLTRLLALSGQRGGDLSGLLNGHEVAAVGQSDGGDTVAALAANTCCADRRLAAVAVLSGAEWGPMPGRYFTTAVPPMLFVQGSADTVNPPWTSKQLYADDDSAARYYLDLFGADHLGPYWGVNGTEQIVARVTLSFFDRYVLGQRAALAEMARQGDVGGAAALVQAGAPVPAG